MVKIYLKDEEGNQSILRKASRRFNLKEEDIEFASGDRFLFTTVFLFAIAHKKIYLKSTDDKKPEVFNIKDVNGVVIENKVDLNLYLKSGRLINLTSIISATKGAQSVLMKFNDAIKANR